MPKNRKIKKLDVTLAFWVALVATIIVVFLALAFSSSFEGFTGRIRDAISKNCGWFYLLTVLFLVFVCIVLMISPAGKIRLGDPDSRPEYSTVSWIAMLFSAGMGIGLVFYGAAEPLSHYALQAPEADPYTQAALRDAFKYCFSTTASTHGPSTPSSASPSPTSGSAKKNPPSCPPPSSPFSATPSTAAWAK